ncbi:deoxyhypusine hydroxylase [Ascobolus immersus RN42]|uniref:Deoxyhypusine hydroxylase n=1 Tax=Ascobolus immersus RN42 TaxID=1160509 RepID=A0A3N4I908_ASCIM|nr:deoxyhypusine hydroxylase [Ascobolus immersus RN42]
MSTAVPQLREILVSEESNLAKRFRALFSLKHLGAQGDKEAIEAIAAGFSTDSALLKHELAYCLGQTKNEHAIQFLEQVLRKEDEDPMVRHESAEALGAVGLTQSLPVLEKYLSDPSEYVRQTCELAIDRIKWENSEKAKSEELQQSAYASIDPAPPLPGSGPANIKKLQDELNDQSLSLFHRYRAMFRLRDIGTHEAIDALASGFADPSALFRHEIAFVFGQMSDPHSIKALIEVAGNEKEASMVRHEAIEAIGGIASNEVEEVLKRFVNDPERVVRESAIVALDMVEFERSGEFEYAIVPDSAAAATA